MTATTRRRLADVSLWASFALNVAATVFDLASGHGGAAAVQSIGIVVVTAWLAIRAPLDAWLEARLGEAVANRQITEIALAQVQAVTRLGDVSVSVNATVGPQMH
jgi:hypothetical protein